MPIEVRCTCGKVLSAAEKLGGTAGTCPFCGASIHYPVADRKSSRRAPVSVAISEKKEPTKRSATAKLLDSTGISDLDEAGKRRVGLAFAIFGLAVLLVVGVIIWWNATRQMQYNTSRQAALEAIKQAERHEASADLLRAFYLYQSAQGRIAWYLKEVDPEDAELKAKLQELVAKLASLDVDTSRRPTRRTPTGDPGQKPPEKGDPNPGAGGTKSGGTTTPRPLQEGTLRELLAKGKAEIYLGLPNMEGVKNFTVAGLGVDPESGLAPIVELWGNPERTHGIPDDENLQLWSYRGRAGFELQVREPSAATGDPGTLERILVYPNFAGTVNGMRVEASTPTLWRREIGEPEPGSVPMLLRYRRPFSGWVSFSSEGTFTQMSISFQVRK